MKNLKKFGALLLTLVMMLSLSVTAFAAEGDTTYSITLDNAVSSETYTAYKIFDATYTTVGTGDDAKTVVSYTISTSSEWYETVNTYATTTTNGLTLTQSAGDATVYVVTVSDSFSVANFAAALDAAKSGKTSAASETANSTSVTLTVTDKGPGYYFVDTTLGSLCSLDTTTPTVTIHEKNSAPTIKKEVASDLTDETYQGYGDGDVFETINYKLTVKTGSNQYGTGNGVDADYTIEDTLPTGFTASADSVSITDWEKGEDKDYTATLEGQKLTIVLKSSKVSTLGQDATIEITYTATMDASKVNIDTNGTTTGNENSVTLSYQKQTNSDTAEVYTYQIGGTADGKAIIQKIDGATAKDPTPTALNGVKFVLSKTDGGKTYYAVVNDQDVLTGWTEYRDTVPADAPEDSVVATRIETKTVDSIEGVLTVKGLDAGEYILTEVETLPGYNLLDDTITVTITPTYTTDDNGNVTSSSVAITYKMSKATEDATDSIVIENNTGSILPSTGGMGTTIFYIVGSVLVLGAAILLVTKRRMNAAK